MINRRQLNTLNIRRKKNNSINKENLSYKKNIKAIFNHFKIYFLIIYFFIL